MGQDTEKRLEHLILMLDELYENRPLYKDSGLWQIRTDDMKEVLYQQNRNEAFYDFIVRCFNNKNKLNLALEQGDL